MLGRPTASSGKYRLFALLNRRATAWVIFALLLALTVLAWRLAVGFVEQEARARFNHAVELAKESLLDRMTAYQAILRAGAGLMTSSDEVTRAEWRQFHDALKIESIYPGIQGLGYTAVLSPDQKDAFEAAVRREGFQEFEIKPAGKRARYSAILYLEPFDWRNQRAFGYDMLSEPVRAEAMDRARDTGDLAMSGHVTLVQETERDVQPGVLLYMPVYRPDRPHATVDERRAALLGYVYSPFRIGDLITGIVGGALQSFRIELYDGTVPGPQALMYRMLPDALTATRKARFRADVPLEIAGRPWTVRFESSQTLEGTFERSYPGLIAIGGVVVSLLLFTILSIIFRNSQRLEQEKVRFERMIDGAPTPMILADSEGWIRQINAACERLTGYPRAELIGRKLESLLAPAERLTNEIWRHRLLTGQNGSDPTAPREISCLRRGESAFQAQLTLARVEFGTVQLLIASLVDLSQLRQLEFRSKWCEALVNSSGDAIISKDSHGVVTSWNPKATELLGYAADEIIGQPITRLVPDEKLDEEWQVMAAIHRGEEVGSFDTLRRCRDGNLIDVSITVSPIRDKQGEVIGGSTIMRDIRARLRQEQDLREREMRYRSVLETAIDGFWLLDADGHLLAVNPAYCRMSGYDEAELLTLHVRDLEAAETPEVNREHLHRIAELGSDRFETMHRRKDGSAWPVEISVTFMASIGQMFVFIRDLSELKALEAEREAAYLQIREFAYHDPLTGLPNRRLLLDRLIQVVAASRRDPHHGALLFIDMDRFKELNDTLGHDMGDLLLIEIARKLVACVRAEDTVARLGGDEFVVMLPRLSTDAHESRHQAEIAGQKILEALNEPFQLQEHVYRSTPSIGAVLFSDEQDVDALLRAADRAMYAVKKNGRNGLQFAEPGQSGDVADHNPVEA